MVFYVNLFLNFSENRVLRCNWTSVLGNVLMVAEIFPFLLVKCFLFISFCSYVYFF